MWFIPLAKPYILHKTTTYLKPKHENSNRVNNEKINQLNVYLGKSENIN